LALGATGDVVRCCDDDDVWWTVFWLRGEVFVACSLAWWLI